MGLNFFPGFYPDLRNQKTLHFAAYAKEDIAKRSFRNAEFGFWKNFLLDGRAGGNWHGGCVNRSPMKDASMERRHSLVVRVTRGFQVQYRGWLRWLEEPFEKLIRLRMIIPHARLPTRLSLAAKT
jgi:hypothetical protein